MKANKLILKSGFWFLAFMFLSCSQEEGTFSEEGLSKTALSAKTCESDGFLYNRAKWKKNGEKGDPRSVCDREGASGCQYSWRVDGNNLFGTHELDLGEITISEDGDGIKWESSGNIKVCRVIIKAGPGINVYGYHCDDVCGTNLVSPDNKDISHITFCYRDRSVYCD